MQRKRFYATQLMKLCFQALLYASLFASFFGMLSITNEAILNITRTAGTTIATFVLTMLLLTVVYGGYDIGVKKMRSVFASISLATFFTDLITYVMLQIMNTNPTEVGHYESEQYTKEIFYSIMQEMFPELEVQITRVNTNPIKYL